VEFELIERLAWILFIFQGVSEKIFATSFESEFDNKTLHPLESNFKHSSDNL